MKTLTYKETVELFEELREIARKYGVSIIVGRQQERQPAFTHIPDPVSKLEGPIFVDYLSDFPRKTKI